MSIQLFNEKNEPVLPAQFTGSPGQGKADIQPPSAISLNSSLDEILIFARQQNASDVHLGAGKPIIFRQFGQLQIISTENVTPEQINRWVASTLPDNLLENFKKTGDSEFVYTIKGWGRFRMAMMKQRNGWDLTARVIPMNIPKFEDTGLPESCIGLTKWAQGLVLISGPAGCGKTTTLAVLIELINQNRHDHIITIEDPIEIVYEPKQCQITQREINTHTLSQNNALRAALREDPDILVVSELRDLKSIQLAVSAAETGHLVFGTMNTVNSMQTISCIIDSFPADEQPIIRNMISESLRGVICQQLIPKKDGGGMIAAYEVLIVNQPVSSLIRSNKMLQINNAIVTSKSSGMVLLENYLEELVNKKLITKEDALERATIPSILLQAFANQPADKKTGIEFDYGNP